jgi:hypothetical protein
MKGMTMKRDPTIEDCERLVIRVLRKHKQIRTYLALSIAVFPKGIKAGQNRILDASIANLVIQGVLRRTKDSDGLPVYSLIESPRSKGK